MKGMMKYIFLLLLVVPLLLVSTITMGKSDVENAQIEISDWQFMWDDETMLPVSPALVKDREKENWLAGAPEENRPPMLDGGYSAWNRFTLPAFPWKYSAIMIDLIKGQNVVVFMDDEQVYEAKRDYMYPNHSLLIPVHPEDAGKTLYIWANGTSHSVPGIHSKVILGDYEQLQGTLIRKGLKDIILGSSLLIMAVIMLISGMFLPKYTIPSWMSLSVVILASGILLVTYSPFLYNFYGDFGRLWVTLFDLSLFAVLPALYYYFENIYGPGPYRILRYCRRFQMIYSIVCLILLAGNIMYPQTFYEIYFVTVKVLGILIIFQMLLLIGITILYASKRNNEAYIFSVGVGMMAAATLGDMFAFYYFGGHYKFFLSKWGIIAMVVSLFVMLERKLVRSHEQALTYSRKLEMFNDELQRSEKMEIISELAASVAHEVRNPLQVTRGFMQLLSEDSKGKEREHFDLALKELDRASSLITDFLSFAKPELEQETKLNVRDELNHIRGILQPLANLSGGTIELDITNDLFMIGNAAKLKQAIINIVKNSIEALDGDGLVRIWAYGRNGEIVIHIQDDGVGMDEEDLARLGEAYFTKKPKGTGLGLMVTFRIIEAMQGSIHFYSKKGSGTEVVIRFPSIKSANSK